MKKILLLIFITLPLASFCQNKISGIIKDNNMQPIPNASIKVTGNSGLNINGSTNTEGSFQVDVPNGTYVIEFDGKGYARKVYDNLEIKDTILTLNAVLSPLNKQIKNLVVKSKAKKDNINAVLAIQKNSVTIMDVVSAEAIKQIPSRTTADVMKRVSGVTLVDNKFIIVRGLSDRYNAAFLNGTPLPSTDADKKSFAFDIFPNSVLENIMVVKAVTPDIPAEVAGGYINLNTSANARENKTTLQVGLGAHSNIISNGFNKTYGGNMDFLGIDDGIRALPSAIPSSTIDYRNLSSTDKVNITKSLANTFGISDGGFTPNANLSATSARNFSVGKIAKLSIIGALSYATNNTMNTSKRFDYNINPSDTNYAYVDKSYNKNIVTAGMLNFGLQLGKKQNITFKNFVNQYTDINNTQREGDQPGIDFSVRSFGSSFTANTLATTQLEGSHALNKKDWKLEWSLGFNKITRNIPDFRSLEYKESRSDDTDSLIANVALIPNVQNAGRFFSKLNENIYNNRLSLNIPFKIKNLKQKVELGTYVSIRDRDFTARRFGYVIKNALSPLLKLGPNEIFATENIKADGFYLDEATQPTDFYDARSNNLATYAMLENKLTERFIITWGARLEKFNLALNSNDGLNDRTYSRDYLNLLPSVATTYRLSEKANLRANYSKTLSRPEFREIAPFAFFDFNNGAVLVGYDSLTQAKIDNVDLRYEIFPNKGQLFSVSTFYKRFQNPIEQNFSTLTGIQTRSYLNSDLGTLLGVETEFRKTLDFLSRKPILERMSIFGNLALMQSKVKYTFNNVVNERAMQGQSNYIVNVGYTYKSLNDYAATIIFNKIGPRIALVGDDQFPNVWEKPRNLIDIQLSKQLNKKLQLTLGVNDLLNNKFILYQNLDNSRKYTNTSRTFVETNVGSRFSLKASYDL